MTSNRPSACIPDVDIKQTLGHIETLRFPILTEIMTGKDYRIGIESSNYPNAVVKGPHAQKAARCSAGLAPPRFAAIRREQDKSILSYYNRALSGKTCNAE